MVCVGVAAITELPLGASCNEIDESRYCAHGLVCHQCGLDSASHCVMCTYIKKVVVV